MLKITKTEKPGKTPEHLVELACALNQQNDYQEILRLVAEKACSLLNAKTASILMLNPRTRQTVKTMYREGLEIGDKKYHSMNTQISGWMLATEQAFHTKDIGKDKRFRNTETHKIDVRSIIAAPINVEGTTLGSIILLNDKSGDTFSEDDKTYLENFAAITAPYLRNLQKIQQFFEAPLPEPALLNKYEEAGLIGRSKKFKEMLHAIEAAARCDVRVMLEGQSGTGKELIARAVHRFSQRYHGPFVAIDCGAIPPHLIESELFGHVRGAFTGATANRKGLFEEAHQGTLFMDEVANLPLDMQAKLMRVLQEGEIKPLGSNEVRKVEVRIITASSRNLKELVQQGDFREDLFYRLHVYPIYIPSLADRADDIPVLAHHFLRRFGRMQNKKANLFHERLLEFMKTLDWAGNIRELENLVERLVTLAPVEKQTIDKNSLPPDLKEQFEKASSHTPEEVISLKDLLDNYETDLLQIALKKYGWNQSKAARSLRMSEQNLRYRMKKLGIVKPEQD